MKYFIEVHTDFHEEGQKQIIDLANIEKIVEVDGITRIYLNNTSYIQVKESYNKILEQMERKRMF